MAVTAKDVARELNLSQTTVSRIFNGDPKYRMSEATRQRVFETAQRLGYQPNAVASSLRKGRTNIVGLYSSPYCDARNEFYGTMIGALQWACHTHNLDLLLHSMRDDIPLETTYAKLSSRRMDGLILRATVEDPLVEILSNSSLPVVTVADALPGIPSVTCDGAAGMKQLIDYLWERGYRDFVYLAPETYLASVDARKQGFTAYLEQLGVEPQNRRIISIHYEHAETVLDELLASGQRTAVCCWNDLTAYNLLYTCVEKGIPIPERLGITGFDGFFGKRIPNYLLTTIACPWAEVAEQALELLVRLIELGSDSDEVGDIVLPVSLVEGNTV